MARRTAKKLSEEFSAAENIANLEEGEEIKITETRTIKKETVSDKNQAAAADTIIIDDDGSDDDAEEAEIYETFPEGTLGNLVFSDDEQLQNLQCNVLVTRKPDSAGEKFRIPCPSRLTHAPIRNVNLTESQSDIEEKVRTFYGGGHYLLQIQIGNKLKSAWNADLADLHESEQSKVSIATNQQPINNSPTEKPLSLLETLQLAGKVKQELFGEETKRMEALEKELADAKAENERLKLEAMETRLSAQINELKNQQPTDEFSQKVKLMGEVKDDQLKKKLMENLIPDASKRSWISDIIDNRHEIKEFIGGFLMPGAANAQPTNFEQMMQEPGDGGSGEEMPPSNFHRQSQTDSEEIN